MVKSRIAVLVFLLLARLASAAACAEEWRQSAMNAYSAGVDATEIEAAIRIVCHEDDITRAASGVMTGCRVCPEETPQSLKALNGGWQLRGEIAGHFNSEHEDQLLLSIHGCEPHAKNFGGTHVFTVGNGKVLHMRYDDGLITDRCRGFPLNDGRDSLVCKGDWAGQGENLDQVYTVHFDALGQGSEIYLFRTEDTVMTCRPAMPTWVQRSKISDIRFHPQDSGQITGFTVTAIQGEIPCSQAHKKHLSSRWAAAVKAYEIEFLFDGQQFQVAPESKAAFQRFAKND